MEIKIDPIFMSGVAPIWVLECVSLYVMTGNTIINVLRSSSLNWENKPKTNYTFLNGPSTCKSLNYVNGFSLLLGKKTTLGSHPLVVYLLSPFLSRASHPSTSSCVWSTIHPFLQFLQQSSLPSTPETSDMLKIYLHPLSLDVPTLQMVKSPLLLPSDFSSIENQQHRRQRLDILEIHAVPSRNLSLRSLTILSCVSPLFYLTNLSFSFIYAILW